MDTSGSEIIQACTSEIGTLPNASYAIDLSGISSYTAHEPLLFFKFITFIFLIAIVASILYLAVLVISFAVALVRDCLQMVRDYKTFLSRAGRIDRESLRCRWSTARSLIEYREPFHYQFGALRSVNHSGDHYSIGQFQIRYNDVYITLSFLGYLRFRYWYGRFIREHTHCYHCQIERCDYELRRLRGDQHYSREIVPPKIRRNSLIIDIPRMT